MLFRCWASVGDGEPTLKQHWINTSCLLGNTSITQIITFGFTFVADMLFDIQLCCYPWLNYYAILSVSRRAHLIQYEDSNCLTLLL